MSDRQRIRESIRDGQAWGIQTPMSPSSNELMICDGPGGLLSEQVG
jgi:hypothetical protein